MSSSISTRHLTADDLPQILKLHALVFGPGRFTRTAYRVREGTPPISRYCRAAFDGTRMVAAVRFTETCIGGADRALLLGPLAVAPDFAGNGHGRALVAEAIAAAKADGVRLVVLVGDEPYYGRFGFRRVPAGQIVLPGPVDPARILAAELEPGALASYRGLIVAKRS
jgi:predicted N-acetyltransferase YhbS